MEIDTIAPNFMYFVTVPNFIDVHLSFGRITRGTLEDMTDPIDLEKSLSEIWASFTGGLLLNTAGSNFRLARCDIR